MPHLQRRTTAFLLWLIATLLAPSGVAAEESSEPLFAMSATFGGKASFVGAEVELIVSPHVRLGAGAGLGMGHLTTSGHVSWYPMGAEKHGVFVDAGVNLFTFPECCGGPELGGSAARLMILPDLGVGWAYQGDLLLFKAGVDFLWLLESELPALPIPIPGVRVGIQI